MGDSALSGVNVLDLSQGYSGGYCTKVLADLGAQVVKVETPLRGDVARAMGPFLDDVPDKETSAPFLYLNAGKKSVTLDIFDVSAQPLLKELIAWADILVENFKPGVMATLGLDYARLEPVNPGLIMVSISYFGQTGTYRDYEGSDLIAYAMSGYMYLTGDEDREPLRAGGYQAEYQAGLSAAMAAVAALTYRDFTGEGQHVDVSAIEALASTFDGVSVFTMFERSGVAPKRAGTRLINRDPHGAYPSRLLPCKDGWVHVHYSPSNPEGLAWLTGSPRLEAPDVLSAMMGHADEIDELLEDWLKDHSREEIQTLAQELRVPFTMVQSIAEVLEDPQNEARKFFVEVEHPKAGSFRYPTSPFRLSESPWRAAVAPLLGEHNEDVFCRTLGHSQAILDRLRESHVV